MDATTARAALTAPARSLRRSEGSRGETDPGRAGPERSGPGEGARRFGGMCCHHLGVRAMEAMDVPNLLTGKEIAKDFHVY
ncbi:hypothetical protein GCM10009603_34440 [Nocardiopsis exhalans]